MAFRKKNFSSPGDLSYVMLITFSIFKLHAHPAIEWFSSLYYDFNVLL